MEAEVVLGKIAATASDLIHLHELAGGDFHPRIERQAVALASSQFEADSVMLRVRRVSESAGRDAFCEVGSVCFHVPINWFREVFDGGSVWERFVSFVGYVNGEAVSTTSIVIGGGVVGVYNVGTLPGFQRRGYGEAVMRHALQEAGGGIGRVILPSTPAGLRLYKRMGFREVGRVSVYSS